MVQIFVQRLKTYHHFFLLSFESPLVRITYFLKIWCNIAAAVRVAKHETWRRKAIWNRVKDFHLLTGIPVTSPIISLIVGTEDKALQASRSVSLPHFLSHHFWCVMNNQVLHESTSSDADHAGFATLSIWCISRTGIYYKLASTWLQSDHQLCLLTPAG